MHFVSFRLLLLVEHGHQHRSVKRCETKRTDCLKCKRKCGRAPSRAVSLICMNGGLAASFADIANLPRHIGYTVIQSYVWQPVWQPLLQVCTRVDIEFKLMPIICSVQTLCALQVALSTYCSPLLYATDVIRDGSSKTPWRTCCAVGRFW